MIYVSTRCGIRLAAL